MRGSITVQSVCKETTAGRLTGSADRKFIRYAFTDNGQSDMKLRYPDINDSLTPVLARKMLLTRLGPEDPDHDDDQGVALETSKPELKQPPLYRVVLLNDDYTPMEFVIHILEAFFYMSREKATQVMLTVHTQGKGVCGVYTKDIAETKAAMVNQYSRDNEHPLVCEVEEVDDE